MTRALKLLPLLVLIIFITIMTGCATIHSTSQSQVDKGPGKRIWAEDAANGYLRLSVPNLDAVAKLKLQCAGTLTGIHTTLWMRDWLLVQAYREEATAWCQNN